MLHEIEAYLQYVYASHDPLRIMVELLLIGFVIYSVLRFLQGTGGEKLFNGLVLVVMGFLVLKLLTTKFQLERIDLISKYFLVGVLLVAIVAFQPELRRGLMRLGGTTFSHNAAPEMAAIIEHVVDAAAMLSRKQIGALIAFERKVGLTDRVALGTEIDGLVTEDMLGTIFWPGSPLHDMGVIIRKGRLAAAGVQFPLAEHGEYDRLLGSRHRAAIGMSKESDAAVVVVSEETGQIALAVDGKLTRFLTLEQLRQQLLDLMLPLVADKKGLKVESREEKVSKDGEEQA